MNANDILKYGHLLVLDTVKVIPEWEWNTPDVCGWWSTRQIMAHLASYEVLLVDVLGQFLGTGEPTPALDKFFELGPYGFNDDEVPARDLKSFPELLGEYTEAYEKTATMIAKIALETRRQLGSLPWYGEAYDLEDFLVYTYYAHKREHCAQIGVFKDLLVREGKL
jgi:hypothetical protein